MKVKFAVFAVFLALSIGFVSSSDLDVAVTDIRLSDENPEIGETLQIEIDITNLGDVETSFGYDFEIQTPGGSIVDGNCCLNLDSGETLTLYYNFEPFVEGDHVFDLEVYSRGDANEENNAMSVEFVVGGSCLGDTNADDLVNVEDWINVILNWGSSEEDVDIDLDGVVGQSDLDMVANNWGVC
jgi:hypothetical protein